MASKFPHPFIAELKRYVASQNATLGPVVMSLSELINIEKSHENKRKHVQDSQKKLSEVTDMIHAAHVFHRCVKDYNSDISQDPKSKALHQDNVLSLLVGDYLLAQSSVDLADLRHPKTVGLIARGLEDYTRGEFLKHDLFERYRKGMLKQGDLLKDLERYAELTCGSLLSNACLSAALLAGYGDRNLTNIGGISNLVYNFGFHLGSAHRLIEFLYCPRTNSEADQEFITNLDVSQFAYSIRSHIDRALVVLLRLPEGGRRFALVDLLNNMKKRSS